MSNPSVNSRCPCRDHLPIVIDTISQKFQESVGTSRLWIVNFRESVAASYTGPCKLAVPPATLVKVVTLPTYLSNPVLEAHRKVIPEKVAALPIVAGVCGYYIVLKWIVLDPSTSKVTYTSTLAMSTEEVPSSR